MSAIELIKLEQNGPYFPSDLKEAEKVYAEYRAAFGFKPNGKQPMVKVGDNPKTKDKIGTLTLFAGSKEGLCTNSSLCEDVCVVNKSVRATHYQPVKQSRIMLMTFLLEKPEHFAAILKRDLLKNVNKNVQFYRLNTNSDVAWEKVFPWIEEIDAKFYDYTKRLARVSKTDGNVLNNYRLTYSATSKTGNNLVRRLVSSGVAVTAVFPVAKGNLPQTFLEIPVLNGDDNDNRYFDKGIVGLSAKGKLKKNKNHPLLVKVG